ncbi:MAG: nitrogen fixation protein NifH [Candidatus Thorarchaeota archaeon]
MAWTEFASQDVIAWLLGPENPSVRFWTLQHLEDKPLTDPDVMEVQDAIMVSQCVQSILREQKGEGHWEQYANMYEPKYRATTHNLLILAELGAKRTKQIEAAIRYLYLFQRDSGHFLIEMPKTDKGRASVVKDGCCLDGNILFYLVHFGYLDDLRTEKLIDFQVEYHAGDVGGWKCRAFPIDRNKVFPENCYMGAVKLLRGLAQIPKEQRSADLDRIIKHETEVILENEIYRYLKNPDGSRKEKAGWKRFGFPLFYQSDVLEVLDVLTQLGVKDDRMQEAIDLVLKNQGKDGKWLLKNTYNGKMFCVIDDKNKPSKWITLRALRVLRRYFS